jgi:hypothetical protein
LAKGTRNEWAFFKSFSAVDRGHITGGISTILRRHVDDVSGCCFAGKTNANGNTHTNAESESVTGCDADSGTGARTCEPHSDSAIKSDELAKEVNDGEIWQEGATES